MKGAILAAALLLVATTGSVRGEGDTSRIDRLDTGVRAAEAVRAVKRLQNSYSHYLDSGLWADLGDLFTENADGPVRRRRGHRSRQPAEAPDGRGRAHGAGPGRRAAQRAHHPAADHHARRRRTHAPRARGTRWRCSDPFGASASWRGGIYENEYVLDNGVWKISRVQFFEQYRGAYDEYGHKAPAKWDVPYHFDSMHVGVTIPKSALDAPSPASKVAPAARLAGLAQRVQRLQDETAVQNLQHSYGYYMDRKLWDDVADLFADDGSWEVGRQGVYVGRAHIRRALEGYYGAPALRQGELFDHILMAPVVTVAPDGRSAERALDGVEPDRRQRRVRALGARHLRERVRQAGRRVEAEGRALLPAAGHRLRPGLGQGRQTRRRRRRPTCRPTTPPRRRTRAIRRPATWRSTT